MCRGEEKACGLSSLQKTTQRTTWQEPLREHLSSLSLIVPSLALKNTGLFHCVRRRERFLIQNTLSCCLLLHHVQVREELFQGFLSGCTCFCSANASKHCVGGRHVVSLCAGWERSHQTSRTRNIAAQRDPVWPAYLRLCDEYAYHIP